MIPTKLILKVHIGENLTKLPIRPAHRTPKGELSPDDPRRGDGWHQSLNALRLTMFQSDWQSPPPAIDL
jgi:hypothetical protein